MLLFAHRIAYTISSLNTVNKHTAEVCSLICAFIHLGQLACSFIIAPATIHTAAIQPKPSSWAIDKAAPVALSSNARPVRNLDMPFFQRRRFRFSSPHVLYLLVALIFIAYASARTNHTSIRNWQARFIEQSKRRDVAKRGPPSDDDDKVRLVITNRCDSTIWPGLATQAGLGPGTGGFELKPGASKNLSVGSNWQGRIWGRTNCTVNGESCACQTGDCFAKLDCEFSVCFFFLFSHSLLTF